MHSSVRTILPVTVSNEKCNYVCLPYFEGFTNVVSIPFTSLFGTNKIQFCRNEIQFDIHETFILFLAIFIFWNNFKKFSF